MTATDTRSTGRTALRRPVLRASGPWTAEALTLLVLVATLLVLGLVMTLSASLAEDAANGSAFSTFQRQATWAGLGLVALFVTARVDHRVWRPLAWVLLAASVVGLVMVLVPGVGLSQDGATRWIAVGPVIVQPSELAKIATLLWLADVAARKHALAGEQPLALRHQLVPALPLFALLAALVLAEPDLGTTLLLALIVGLVLWFEGLPVRFVAVGLVVVGALTVVAIRVAGYRRDRIQGWLDPTADPGNTGYQLLQSLYALGSGGWFGLGLGSSRGKWAYIPNPETDFIFAIIGEELGLVGALFVLALFTGVLVAGLRVARQAHEPFGRVVAAGITAWLVGQAFLNIGTVTGLVPITGVTLPLVSVGGSSLVSTLLALGILLSIARDDRHLEAAS
jgi:cell division protein FtsW